MTRHERFKQPSAQTGAPIPPGAGGAGAAAQDAVIFSLAERLAELNRVRLAASLVLEEADAHHRPITTPIAVIKTEIDASYRFFIDSKEIGEAYDREDIALLRAFIRKHKYVTPAEYSQVMRARDILEAWRPWQAALEAEEERSGFEKAEQACYAADDACDEILVKLIAAPAGTIDGVLAKARAFRPWLPSEKFIEETIHRDLDANPHDRELLALDLARNILGLQGLLKEQPK